jgi:Concanavalin A-like lectin/glucanases superfamily
MRRSAGIVAALGSLSACSLIVSTSGLAGDPERPSGGEGGMDAPAALDGPGPADGTSDAADATADARTSPCTGQHLFCDDFDDGPVDPKSRWTTSKQEAGPLTLDTTSFVSAPRSLLMSVQPGAGTRVTEIRKEVSPSANALRIDLDMRSPGPSDTSFGEYDPITVRFFPTPTGVASHQLGIAIYPNGATFEYHKDLDNGGASNDAPSFTFPFGRWVHVTVTVSFATSKATIALDGVKAAEVALTGASLTRAEIAVGATYALDANVTWPFSFDNVVAD